ncbi:molybdate ABC transporter substrate-binding protein [Phormidesmis priestleyi ULC007]|uniref:Molybdate ABC transporter substrate-binding protein n=2 Tax=Phormidesmis priestleyi TaxID=268141 RepID=A0A2T1DJ70_9CYAN|nr:molybdate ABC transporter substrate-binding protein [Phormidesmis priestleyi ULC007]PZO54192.1 MAG: molybdate ABC transporter substrate-binding protein [Phormidesmis priestleyi]
MRVKTWRVGLLSFWMTVLLIACTQLAPPAPQLSQQTTVQSAAQTSTLLVAAAASLQKALQEITPLYTQANSNQTINYNFAASGALQQQIEQGAPVDVFISAAEKQMKALQEKGSFASGTQRDLLTNQLVLITPKQAAVSLTDFQQLVKPEIKRISIGEPRSVPAGQYSTEVLKNLGILEQVQSKFVFGSNVKSVLTAVETGDVDAGIVYITDAKSSDQITIAATADQKLHSPILYPIAVLKSSKSIDSSKRYAEFLQSDPAKAVFEKYGFGIAKP